MRRVLLALVLLVFATGAAPRATLPDIEDEQKRLEANRYTFRLVHLADILAVTTSTE